MSAFGGGLQPGVPNPCNPFRHCTKPYFAVEREAVIVFIRATVLSNRHSSVSSCSFGREPKTVVIKTRCSKCGGVTGRPLHTSRRFATGVAKTAFTSTRKKSACKLCCLKKRQGVPETPNRESREFFGSTYMDEGLVRGPQRWIRASPVGEKIGAG